MLLNNMEANVKLSRGMESDIIAPADLVLVTGAGGFIGTRVVESLLRRGFRRIRCFVRPSSSLARLRKVITDAGAEDCVQLVTGNLQSRNDCKTAVEGVAVIYHLAAGRGEKSYPDAFLNSVVTTRNLIEAAVEHGVLRRFVSVGSFTVYSNRNNPHDSLLEDSPVEEQPHLRGEAYCYAKVRQDELIIDYGRRQGLPYVILRPGYVYGPGNEGISSRVGIGTFGIFLHLGGSRPVPLSYVDNCAEAIVLAGLRPGVNGQIFNVVDDELVSSRKFLRLYKQHVRRFHSLYLPRFASYFLCWLWEAYSDWSKGQLPRAYNRLAWHAYWKGSRYSNQKLKQQLGWSPVVSTEEGLKRYFESCRRKLSRA